MYPIHKLVCHGILEETSMDEKELATKLGCMKTHEATMNFTLDNYEKTYKRYSSILGGP